MRLSTTIQTLLNMGYDLAVVEGDEGTVLCKASQDFGKVYRSIESVDFSKVYVLQGRNQPPVDVMAISERQIVDSNWNGVVEKITGQ